VLKRKWFQLVAIQNDLKDNYFKRPSSAALVFAKNKKKC